jgi:flagellar motor switch protein FliM
LSEILSQSEIEALLASLTGEGGGDLMADLGGGDTGSGGGASGMSAAPSPFTDVRAHKPDGRPIAYEVYDFRRPDKFAKDQMRTLQMLHETFARLYASSLSAYLRVSTHVDLISVEQVPYEEYTKSLTSSIITVFSMAPLAGSALLEMEFSIVLSMIDRLLGGPGNMVKLNTILTEIEQALTESISQRALRDLKLSWEGVAKFTPRQERIETQAQFLQIVPPSDTVFSILFEVKVGDLRGAMSLCIPYTALKPIAGKLSAQRWFSSNVRKGYGPDARVLARQLEKTTVEAVCRLGTTSISVGELIALKEGDTLVLDREADEEIDLLIGGNVKFRGKPGQSGRKVALHINRPAADDIPILRSA